MLVELQAKGTGAVIATATVKLNAVRQRHVERYGTQTPGSLGTFGLEVPNPLLTQRDP